MKTPPFIYCCLSNRGALVHPRTSAADQDELSSLLQVPVVAGTVNQGSAVLGGGLVVNDFCAYWYEVLKIHIYIPYYSNSDHRKNF